MHHRIATRHSVNDEEAGTYSDEEEPAGITASEVIQAKAKEETIRGQLKNFAVVMYVITALMMAIDFALIATGYFSQFLIFLVMNSVFMYTCFCFAQWQRTNHRGTRAALERAILGTMIMSAIIWISSLVMIYSMFVQYGKS